MQISKASIEETRIQASYGDETAQYAAVRKTGAGVIDLSSRGRIAVAGLEAVPFLNGLITNDMKMLLEDTWMPAVFPNAQGRLVASVRVMRLKDMETDKSTCPSYLIDTEPATHDGVLKILERFTLAGDFRVKDISVETAQFTVQGKKADEVVRSLMGDDVPDLPKHGAIKISWKGVEITTLRASHTAAPGFDLIVPADSANELWRALIDAHATPVGAEVFEVLRIEAGIPRHGVDMDETNVVTETNLDDAVSYTKGCYIGQEIIARIKYRGHVARKLVGLSFDGKARVEPGGLIRSSDDKDIGRITSTAYSPQLRRTIALGYVKYDYLASGTVMKLIHNGNAVTANVAELPFIHDEQRDAG